MSDVYGIILYIVHVCKCEVELLYNTYTAGRRTCTNCTSGVLVRLGILWTRGKYELDIDITRFLFARKNVRPQADFVYKMFVQTDRRY